MRKIKKAAKILVRFLLVIGLVAITTDILISNHAKGKTTDEVEAIAHNKVGMVLGTSKFLTNGRENLYFTYRIQAAAELYHNRKIDFILVSGDNGSKYYDEPTQFKKALIEQGIPEEVIYLDYAGFRTLDSVVRAKKVFGQSSLTIISQKFHNERAIYLAEKNGITAIGFNAQDVTVKYGFKTRIREYLARTKAIIDVLLGVDPKFLGEEIVIE